MTLLTTFIVLALLATIGTLVTGIVSMGHGGSFDEQHSTQLMSARVILQLLAIILILASLFISAS